MSEAPPLPRRVRLVLVGIGHAHLEVLRRLAEHRRDDLDLVAVSQHDLHHYSGMVPGYLAGIYEESELTFDLATLTARAGGRFRRARAAGLDPERRQVVLDGGPGERLPYDLVSLNVGSLAGGQTRSDVRDHATALKPMTRAVALKDELGELAGGAASPRIAVVGAGAAGFEVACAAAALLAGSGRGRVTLVDAGDRILGGYPPRARRLARRELGRRGIATELGAAVDRVGADGLRLEDGRRLDADLMIWLTGAAAPRWLAESGLPVDGRGFQWVDGSQRSVGDRRVFAAGDCATLADHPETPKAGVYSVRQGPILWRALAAALDGDEPPTYEPQSGFLSLLNTCDGRAILSWRGAALHRRWAWWLKDWIDRRFVARYSPAPR